MTEGKRNIIRQLLQEYDIETAEDIQDALKDLLGGTIKEGCQVIVLFFMWYCIFFLSQNSITLYAKLL